MMKLNGKEGKMWNRGNCTKNLKPLKRLKKEDVRAGHLTILEERTNIKMAPHIEIEGKRKIAVVLRAWMIIGRVLHRIWSERKNGGMHWLRTILVYDNYMKTIRKRLRPFPLL